MKKPVAILTALFIFTYLCFPVLVVFAENENSFVWRKVFVAVLGAVGVVGIVAVTLKIRVKRHGR